MLFETWPYPELETSGMIEDFQVLRLVLDGGSPLAFSRRQMQDAMPRLASASHVQQCNTIDFHLWVQYVRSPSLLN